MSPAHRALAAAREAKDRAHAYGVLRAGATPEHEPSGLPLAERLEVVRARYVYGALDAALTVGISRPPEATSRSSGYDRVRGIFQRLDRAAPRLSHGWREWILRGSRLPFRDRGAPAPSANGTSRDAPEIIGFGRSATVYRLSPSGREGTSAKIVVKVHRKSLGRGMEALRRHAAYLRSRYDAIEHWFEGCGLLLPTRFLILHAPLLDRPAVASVQPFVEVEAELGPIEDAAELEELLSAHAALREQFVRMVDRTLRLVEAGHCLDLAGEGNLVVAREDGVPRLRLLDPGIWHLEARKRRSVAAFARLEDRLDRYRALAERLDGSDPRLSAGTR